MLVFKHFKTQDVGVHPLPDPEYDGPITPSNIEKLFSGCDDFTSRYITAGGTDISLFACWLDGTVSGSEVSEQILRPLTDPVRFGGAKTPADIEALLDRGSAYANEMQRLEETDGLVSALSYGYCALVFDGKALAFQVKTDQHRTIQEPSVEKSVKGSKDAFVETLRVNTTLVRSRLRTPKLKLSQTIVGRKSHTDAAVMWMENVADPALVEDVKQRLDGLDVDGLILPEILDSGLVSSPKSPFPQLIHTERPDKFAACMLDGRVGVLVEGIPVGFIAPASLPEFMKTNEDGAQHFLAASFIRILRWAALFITLLLPAFYIAIAMYHAEMIPTKLLLSVIESKQSVPFSTSAEVMGMLLAFELLQEAGLRLPNAIGQTVSIIGALIVGQSAVDAEVISPIAVIVVALAGIAGYTMPSQDLGTALRLFRFLLALAAVAAGMFGLVVGATFIIWHLCSIESFGRAYVSSSLTGHSRGGSQAVFIRKPPWTDKFRDPTITGGDIRRQA